ncbi:MAG: YraN family protein [Clostridia bacterium]
MDSHNYGKKCEIIAQQYLIKKGYIILETNYKNKVGEIDIIAKDGDYIVFVEVKGRFSRQFGDPLEAIDERKQIKIHNVATLYLITHKKMNSPCRFDAISVLGDAEHEIRHIVDAF